MATVGQRSVQQVGILANVGSNPTRGLFSASGDPDFVI